LHTINDGDLILGCCTVTCGSIFSASEDNLAGYFERLVEQTNYTTSHTRLHSQPM